MTIKPIPTHYRNARHLTAREVRLLKFEHRRATRRWIVFRDDAGRVIVGRPQNGSHEIHSVTALR